MTMKLLGVGTYEVLEDDNGKPSIRIKGHILKSSEVFEQVLDASSEIVKAVSQNQPTKQRKLLHASLK